MVAVVVICNHTRPRCHPCVIAMTPPLNGIWIDFTFLVQIPLGIKEEQTYVA